MRLSPARVPELDRFQGILDALPQLSVHATCDLLGRLPDYLSERLQLEILSRLPAPLPPAVQVAAFEAACRIEDVDVQRRAWDVLLSRFDASMFPRLQTLWTDALAAGERLPRGEFLARLPACVPIMRMRGGDSTLAEAVRAVHDAGLVWP
jgi:hypothetical protein